MVFGIEYLYYEELRNTGGTFYCVNGHSRYFCETEVVRLKRKLEYEEARREEAETDRDYQGRRAAAYKGHWKQTKRKIAAGDCPCCAQHFEDLKTHMEHVHPKYVEQEIDDRV